MIFDKHRFEVWNLHQHPYRHNLTEFSYTHDALPGVTNVESALNYVLAVLYPNTKANVPTPGDLPTGTDTPNVGDVTPTVGDYRVVDDDGDGKSAGYRWEEREGGAPITAPVTSAENLSNNNELGASSNTIVNGNSFLNTEAGDLSTSFFRLRFSGAGITGNITSKIYNDNGSGSPNIGAGAIATSDPINVTAVPAVNTDVIFTYSTPVTLAAGTTYHVILDISGLTFTGGTLFQRISVSNPYAGGARVFSSNGGASFSPVPTQDMVFNITVLGTTYAAIAQWYKVFDVDWSTDAILAAVTDVTNDLYFYTKGKTDLDVNGDPITGLYAGQKVYGGNLANQNMTLNANSGDGVGAQTGFVQVDSQFRPTIDDLFDLSTATERWKDAFFSNQVVIDTLTISTGSITDSSGDINFDNENLTTTGNITGAIVKGSSLVADDTFDSVTLVPGSYTDTTGAVSFGAANLVTTGTLGAGVTTLTENTHQLVLDPDNGSGRALITSSQGNIDFVDENLYTTGQLNVGTLVADQLDVDNLRLDGNTVSSTDTNGNIILLPNGTGLVDVQKALQTLGITATGIVGVTGSITVDNLSLDGNTLSTTDANGNLILSPNGTGHISITSSVLPSAGGFDFGSSSALLNDIFLSGGIRNATNEIAISTLLAFRSGVWRDLAQTTPALAGDTLFYDAINNVWLANHPDTEITHSELSGVTTGDAGHTQFAMLTGRVGGQVIQGGTAASNNLVLESTSNATKGSIFLRDNASPEVDASFSAGWAGTDLGDSTHYYRDLYSKGEHFGLRLENVTSGTLPSSSAQNTGRLLWATDTNKAYVDTGLALKVLGVAKFSADQAFDGIINVKNVDVSSEIQDARQAQWQLLDNANDFEILYVTIKMTSASNVRIETSIPLPVGSYRLIGIE